MGRCYGRFGHRSSSIWPNWPHTFRSAFWYNALVVFLNMIAPKERGMNFLKKIWRRRRDAKDAIALGEVYTVIKLKHLYLYSDIENFLLSISFDFDEENSVAASIDIADAAITFIYTDILMMGGEGNVRANLLRILVQISSEARSLRA
jgi:hypothetical protein